MLSAPEGGPTSLPFSARTCSRLSRLPPGLAPGIYNRDIGLLARDQLAALGLLKRGILIRHSKKAEMQPLQARSAADRELLRDAVALYQVADDLYMHDRYQVEESSPAQALPEKPREARVSRVVRRRNRTVRVATGNNGSEKYPSGSAETLAVVKPLSRPRRLPGFPFGRTYCAWFVPSQTGQAGGAWRTMR